MFILDRLGYLEHPAGNFRSPAGLVISCQGLNALMVPSCRIKFLCTELVEYSNANILGPEVANANVQSCAAWWCRLSCDIHVFFFERWRLRSGKCWGPSKNSLQRLQKNQVWYIGPLGPSTLLSFPRVLIAGIATGTINEQGLYVNTMLYMHMHYARAGEGPPPRVNLDEFSVF